MNNLLLMNRLSRKMLLELRRRVDSPARGRKWLAFILIAWLSFASASPAALAEGGYSPDNANKIDPLQTAKFLGGNFRVGEFTGAALYDYPIKLPEGRNGMTPSIAISHNQQDTSLDNIVGFHWDLTRYSIRRLNKNGVEKIYDQTYFVAQTPVDSGELVALNLADTQHGLYGMKIENAFARYEFLEDNSWLITDKTGTQYKFGASVDTQQFDPEDPTRIYQWMLEEIRDRNDNFIRYTYYKVDNQLYPKTITYTGNGDQEGLFEVRFLPFANGTPGAQRADKFFSYAQGFRVDTNYLITGIEVRANGVLRRKYDIAYTQVAPLVRNTISQITETGYDSTGIATTLPATRFEYTPSDVKWEKVNEYYLNATNTARDYIIHSEIQWNMNGPYVLPNGLLFEMCYSSCSGGKDVYHWEMDGDGVVDVEFFGGYGSGGYPKIRISPKSDGTWETKVGNNLPSAPAYAYEIPGLGEKTIDFDGNGILDLVRSYVNRETGKVNSLVKYSQGLVSNQSDTIPIPFSNSDAHWPDSGTSIGDLNGDGLADVMQSLGGQGGPIVKTCLNTDGSRCSITNFWQAPIAIIVNNTNFQHGRQVVVQDCNYDGLSDFKFTGSGATIYLNNGKGGWTTQNAGQCVSDWESTTVRQLDANGDGLIDRVAAYIQVNPGTNTIVNDLTLGGANGSVTYKNRFPIILGTVATYSDSGVRIMDLNSDGLPDIVQSVKNDKARSDTVTDVEINKGIYLNKGSRPYFLKTIRTSEGGQIDMEYKTSGQYLKPDGSRANPKLPFLVDTVSKVKVTDGLGNQQTTDYFYEDGHYFYADTMNREMAGFRVVTKTDSAGVKTVSYYHQSESSVQDAANGEYQDHISKKGRTYREEVLSNSGQVMQVAMNRWEKTDLGNGRIFPNLKHTVTVTKAGGEKALAKGFLYDQFGNITRTEDYGEVVANSDGSFYDIGDDMVSVLQTYTENQTDYLVGLPAESDVISKGNEVLKSQKFYYDDQPIKGATKGNRTKTETWLNTNNTYLAERFSYNDFGLVVSQTNPRGFITQIEYDEWNLYPIRTTNPLGHISEITTDIATGNTLTTQDPNGLKTANVYDGAGRLKESRISDVADPNTLVLSKQVNYVDYTMPRSVQTITHNDDGNSVEQFTYLDGLGRTIETKTESSNGQWVTTGTLFDQRGNVSKQLLPYFSTYSPFEPVSSTRAGTSYTYDALNRPVTEVTPVGTTTIAYEGWNKRVTDGNDNQKVFVSGARGQLLEVHEYALPDIHITRYTYDPLSQLIGMTDAEGNQREFRYNSMGQRVAQTTAHRAGESMPEWHYSYDENGNLIRQTDANGIITEWLYDPLDRVVSENASSVYTYDTGDNAIGRLVRVTAPNYEHRMAYDLYGRVTENTKVIEGKSFTHAFAYDRMGAMKKLTYPDATEADYQYDPAHLLTRVSVGSKVFADSFQYTPTGQIAQIRLGGKTMVTNNYDAEKMYRLVSKQAMGGSGTYLQQFSYTYDAVGNMTQLIDSGVGITAKNIAFTYDPLYRLTEARYTATANNDDRIDKFSYSPTGNMMFKSDVGDYTYGGNHPHAVTIAGEKMFEYDANGNQIKRDDISQTFDYRNRLIKSGEQAEFIYGEGYERVIKKSLETGNITYYPSDYFEVDDWKETKYIFAGKARIAKIEKLLPPPVNPPVLETEIAAEVSQATLGLTGTKDAGSSIWINDLEVLPANGFSQWAVNVTLQEGENTIRLYAKKNGKASSSQTFTVTYTPAPEPEIDPETDTDEGGNTDTGTDVDSTGGSSGGSTTTATTQPTTSAQTGTGGGGGFSLRSAKTVNLSDTQKTSSNDKPARAKIEQTVVTRRGGQSIISWQSRNEQVTTYAIYRSAEPFGEELGDPIATVEAKKGIMRYRDNDVKKGENYFYKIIALTEKGNPLAESIDLSPYEYTLKNNGIQVIYLPDLVREKYDYIEWSADERLNVTFDTKTKRMTIQAGDGLMPRGGVNVHVEFKKCEYEIVCRSLKVIDFTIKQDRSKQRFSLEPVKSFFAALIPTAHAEELTSPPAEEEKIYFLLTDHLGSITHVLDEDGAVVEQRDYLAYGSERVSDGESGEKKGFSGKELDSETDLQYFSARYYDSTVGRFIGMDPWEGSLNNPQTLNKYSYVVNNPTNNIDPTGMIPKDASVLSKLWSIMTFDTKNKGSGWLSYSAKQYGQNQSQENLTELQNRQTIALSRFLNSPSSFTDETWDPVTNNRIQTLDPRLHIPATDFINEVEEKEGMTLRVSDAYRSIEAQDELYAQSRTKPGPWATDAKGGQSYHNYGLAIDVAEIKNKMTTGRRMTENIAKIAEKFGFEWGGYWPPPKTDYPHFEMTFGQSTKELKAKKDKK